MLGHLADDVLARLGPPHHPPERPVPLRPARASVPDVLRAPRPRSASPPARRAATPCATSWLPPRRRLPATRCSTSPRGPRPRSSTSCATRSRSACPASSRSTSPAARPTAARRCSTTSASIAVDAHARRRHGRARLPRVHRRRPRRQPAPGAGARGVHVARRPAADDRGDPAGVRPTTATATTSCGPA